MKRIKLADIEKSYGFTNWGKLRQLDDAEIEAAAMKSWDAKLLTDVELAQLRRAQSKEDGL